MEVYGNSDIGRVRKRNEDSFKFGKFDDGVIWAVVCDGMGGALGGQTASTIATEMVSEKIVKCYNKSMPLSSLDNLLLSAITTANVTVYDRAISDENLNGMGTTIVAAIIKDNTACIAHVGDSRAYKITGNDSIIQITKDHSLVQQMLDNGQITAEQYENHPIKNIITRALGVEEDIEIDFNKADISENDALLICTDGLSGLVNNEELLEKYNEFSKEELPDEYIRTANENGGRDNITVVVVKG